MSIPTDPSGPSLETAWWRDSGSGSEAFSASPIHPPIRLPWPLLPEDSQAAANIDNRADSFDCEMFDYKGNLMRAEIGA